MTPDAIDRLLRIRAVCNEFVTIGYQFDEAKAGWLSTLVAITAVLDEYELCERECSCSRRIRVLKQADAINQCWPDALL